MWTGNKEYEKDGKRKQSQRKEGQGGKVQGVELLPGFVYLSGDGMEVSSVTLKSSTRSLGSIVAVLEDRRDEEACECDSGITRMATKKNLRKGYLQICCIRCWN